MRFTPDPLSAATSRLLDSVQLPEVKALPDLDAMVEAWGEARFREGCQRRVDHDLGCDAADYRPVIAEIERLQGKEFHCDELIEASRGVLLVLSLLADEVQALRCHTDAVLVVEKFRAAVEGAQ